MCYLIAKEFDKQGCIAVKIRHGKGYDRSNLYHCLKFYKTFPEIIDTVCRQSQIRLTWSHYRTLLKV